MSDNGAYAGLRRAARAGKPETQPETPETEAEDEEEYSESDGGKKKKKEPEMSNSDNQAAIAAAREEGRAAGAADTHARYATVMASEHYAGREKLAMKLLGNDKLSADEIVDTLEAAEPATTTAESSEDRQETAEAAARAEMKDAIKGQANSNIDVGGSGGTSQKAGAQSVWAAAHENIGIKATA